jgi:hypothetical protein
MIRLGLASFGAADDPAWEACPTAVSWLCLRSWDAIQPRKPGRLTVTPTATGWQATLTLDSEARKGSVRFRWFEELLPQLEALCLGRVGEWVELETGKGAQRLRDERRKLLDARKAKQYKSTEGEGEDG